MVSGLEKKILTVFCLFVSIVQATFKTNWYGKSVYLSSSTSKFLKTVVPQFEKWSTRQNVSKNYPKDSLLFYRAEILRLLRSFRNSDKMEGKDIEQLGQCLHKSHDLLLLDLKKGFFGVKNRYLQKHIKEIGIDISTAIRQVYVGTAEAELKIIDNYLRAPAKENTAIVYGLIQDIIKHFDGISVTEYDFVVLASSALFVLYSTE